MTRTWIDTSLVLAIVLSLSGCDVLGINDGAPGDEPPRDSVQQAYYEDAQQLAVRRMVAENDTTVHIPDQRVQPFYEALLAVYDARRMPARDSILDIHTRKRYSLHEIIVGVDATVGWTEAWENEQGQTGYAPIDDVLETYKLSFKEYFDSDGVGAAILRSENPLNPVGLRAQFEGITGIRYVESNGQMGRGADIRADVLETDIRLRYTRGWGDCFSGCIHEKTWTFRVENGGRASFEGVTQN